MHYRWIIALVFTLLLIPITSFAQTVDNIELDSRNHHGEISIKNVKASEKEFYNVIILNVQIKVKDLALEDIVSIYPDSIKLVNENGKLYFPTRDECNMPEPAIKVPDGGPCYEVKNDCGKPAWSFTIKGTEGGIGNYYPCFRVEKEFSNFKVYYGYEKFGKSLPDSYQIGNIDLNRISQQTAQKTEKSLIDDVRNVKIPDMTESKDFFSQLFDMIKNLFKFF